MTCTAQRVLAVVAAAFLAFGLSNIAHAELITNGTFEANTGSDGGNATGWTKTVAFGIYDGVGNLNAPGTVFDSWAYVPGGGNNTSAGAYQTLGSTLVAGTEYTLSFQTNAWGAGTGNNVRVGKFNGGDYDDDADYGPLPLSVVDIAPDATQWHFRSYTFTAIGGEDTVYFGTAVAGTNNGADIDNVSLVANIVPTAPEPSTLVLAALGLVGLAVRRRRKR